MPNKAAPTGWWKLVGSGLGWVEIPRLEQHECGVAVTLCFQGQERLGKELWTWH